MTSPPDRTHPTIVAAAVLLAALTPAAAAPPATAARDEAGDRSRRLTTIQNTCFNLYPADLLFRMTGREGPVPDQVRADPRLQMKYLATEGIVMKGLFYPSLLEEILPAFEAAVRPGMRLLDLGSGDGRVVFMAALLGAEATGIEFDREIHAIARRARRALRGVIDPGAVTLRRGDFFAIDLSGYDAVFYFGSGSYSEKRLFEKVRAELRPGALFLLAHGQWGSLPDMELEAEYGVVRVFRAGGASRAARIKRGPGAPGPTGAAATPRRTPPSWPVPPP